MLTKGTKSAAMVTSNHRTERMRALGELTIFVCALGPDGRGGFSLIGFQEDVKIQRGLLRGCFFVHTPLRRVPTRIWLRHRSVVARVFLARRCVRWNRW